MFGSLIVVHSVPNPRDDLALLHLQQPLQLSTSKTSGKNFCAVELELDNGVIVL